MSELVPILGTALLTGLVGSAHCLGMCAGISGLFAANTAAASLRSQWPMALAYNAGRLLSYTFLGVLVGSFGSALVAAIPAVTGPVRAVTGAIIVLIGLQVAFDLQLLRPVEYMGTRIWQRLAPVARHFVPVTTLPRALGLGLLWGWLPCGLVYSVLLVAATQANAAAGGMTMLVFGLGTLPAMLMTGLGAARVAAAFRRRGARLGLGLLLVALGLLTVAMPAWRVLGANAAHHPMSTG